MCVELFGDGCWELGCNNHELCVQLNGSVAVGTSSRGRTLPLRRNLHGIRQRYVFKDADNTVCVLKW